MLAIEKRTQIKGTLVNDGDEVDGGGGDGDHKTWNYCLTICSYCYYHHYYYYYFHYHYCYYHHYYYYYYHYNDNLEPSLDNLFPNKPEHTVQHRLLAELKRLQFFLVEN